MKLLLCLSFILFINLLFCQIDFYIETDETYYTYGQDIYITFNLHNTSSDTAQIAFPCSFPFQYYIDDELFSFYSNPIFFYLTLPPDSTFSTCCVHSDNVDIGNHLLIGEFLGYQFSWFTNPILIIVEQVSVENHELQQIGCKLSNYPNPFNPSTTIVFNLSEIRDAQLDIYNIKGQKVKNIPVILSDMQHCIEGSGKNSYSITWNGTDDNNQPVSSGIYFYKLKTVDFQKTKKMILMK